VKFGWCAPLKDIDLVMQAGFDYIELPLAAQGLEDRATFETSKKAIAASPLPTASFNYFMPRDMRVVGPDVDVGRVKSYLARAADLLESAGARACVFGAAWARNIADDWDRQRAEQQFLETLGWCADALQGTGVTLAIEPLYRKESNFINSVAEGVHFARQVNRPEIRVLADFFHMDEENEPFDTLIEHRQWLAHIHLADTGRKNPGTGSYPYAQFFGALKQAGYDRLMSCECGVDDPATGLRHSVNFLRQRWSEQSADQPPLTRDTARQ
jgi:sugar phosphate isomerase/epimerase